MNRIVVASLVLLGSTVALAQDSAFPGCTPNSDIPQAVIDYFSKHNQPLPSKFCVGPIVENPNVPEDGGAPQVPVPEEVTPPEESIPEAMPPEGSVQEETYNEQPPVPEEGVAEGPPAEGEVPYDAAEAGPPEQPPVAEYPEGPAGPPPLVAVGPHGVDVNIPGIFQFHFQRRHARREARWIRKGLRRGYVYPQPYPEQSYAK